MIKNCEECKVKFETNRKRQRYCSLVCKHRSYSRREWQRDRMKPDKREKNRIKSHNYYLKHKSDRQAYTENYLKKIRIEVLTYYGNGKLACAQCGESRLGCLSIDHINNRGNEDRRQHGKYGTNFYKLLKRTNYPLGYQTLCMNCQFVKMHDFNEYRRELVKE